MVIFMNKQISMVIILNVLLFCSINSAQADQSDALYIWNADSICIRLYESVEACVNNELTTYYLLNGFQLDLDRLNMGAEISSIVFLKKPYYFKTETISNKLPFVICENCFFIGHPLHDTPRYSIDDASSPIIDNQMIIKDTNLCILGRREQGFLFCDQNGIGITTADVVSSAGIHPQIRNMLSEENAIEIAAESLQKKYSTFDLSALHSVVMFNPEYLNPEQSYYIVVFYPGEDSRINYYSVYMNAIDGTIERCEFCEQSFG